MFYWSVSVLLCCCISVNVSVSVNAWVLRFYAWSCLCVYGCLSMFPRVSYTCACVCAYACVRLCVDSGCGWRKSRGIDVCNVNDFPLRSTSNHPTHTLPSLFPVRLLHSLSPFVCALFPSLPGFSHLVKMTACDRFKKPGLIVPCFGCQAMSSPASPSAAVSAADGCNWSLPPVDRSTQIRAFDSWRDPAIHDSFSSSVSVREISSAQSYTTTNVACSLVRVAQPAPQCRRFNAVPVIPAEFMTKLKQYCNMMPINRSIF